MMPHTNHLQIVGSLEKSAPLHLRSRHYLTLYQKVFFENSKRDEL